MNVLVRTPNWLGDLVMSYAFFEQLERLLPDAQIDVVIKKNLVDLMDLFPMVQNAYVFDKKTHGSVKGLYQFGNQIRQTKHYDYFFVLPDSFSSALMAFATRSKKRVGYSNEARSFLLTQNPPLPKEKIHRCRKYIRLLEYALKTEVQDFSNRLRAFPKPFAHLNFSSKPQIILNLQSVASSRSMPLQKSIEIIQTIRDTVNATIILTGLDKDIAFMTNLCKHFKYPEDLIDLSGKTSLMEFTSLLYHSDLVIGVDSGPAHLANVLGVSSIVFLGAGDIETTVPYEQGNLVVLREDLPCSPCVSNTCHLKTLDCLNKISLLQLKNAIQKFL